MSPTVQRRSVLDVSALPGAAIVARIRRLIVTAVLAALAYSALMTASKGSCPGSMTADGEFIDATGKVVNAAPDCVSLELGPSGLVYLTIVAIVIHALTLVLRHANDVPSAARFLERAAAAIVVLVVASIIIAQVWFAMIPLTEGNSTGPYFYPFPFGTVELVIEPMTTS